VFLSNSKRFGKTKNLKTYLLIEKNKCHSPAKDRTDDWEIIEVFLEIPTQNSP
jgi:hypothetical protein